MMKTNQSGMWLLQFAYFSVALIALIKIATFSQVLAKSDRFGGGPDAVELIRDMTSSVENSSYEGTFVYLADGQVETMRIKHVNANGNINEHLVSLNGEAREIFRDSSIVTSIWPTSQMTIYFKSKKQNLESKFYSTLRGNKNYQFIIFPDDRVAGRDAHVISVKSKDKFRYSYKFWIDRDTKMLLRSISFDDNNRSIEQVMFTDIRFSDNIVIEDVNTKVAHLNYANQAYKEATDLSKTDCPVRFEGLPVGYIKVGEKFQPKTVENGAVHHISLSDGVASVSVFVEMNYIPTELDSIGLSTLGGVAAYSGKLGAAYATVIGEVPIETVREIAQAVKLD